MSTTSMNPETYVIAYWLSNNEESRHDWCLKAQRHSEEAKCSPAVQAGTQTADDVAVRSLADELRCHLFEQCDLLKQLDVYADLLLGALGAVEWRQLADYFLRECRSPCRSG